MIRTTVTPNKNTISIDIPQSYIGKEIEIIAFAKSEGLENHHTDSKKALFTVLHVDNKGYQFDRDEANAR